MNFFKRLFLKHCIVRTIQSGFIAPDFKYYYERLFICTNCGKFIDVFVKKGIYLKYAITNIKCPNCGCKPDRELK